MASNQNELELKLRHLQVTSRKVMLDLLAGEYRSAFKGTGVEFEDLREYVHGDDVKTIDWNVTARTGSPHMKKFLEERELSLYFLIDVSGSQDFGSGELTKTKLAMRIFSLLAYAAAHNHDKVGMILFSDQVEVHENLGKGSKHVMRLLDVISSHRPLSKRTDIYSALDYLNQVRSRRCVVFLLSDFVDKNYDDALRETARLHDFICVHLVDKRESELPKGGMFEFVDAESGATQVIDCGNEKLRDIVRERAQKMARHLKDLCHEVDADFLPIRTDDDIPLGLIKFLKTRSRRSANT